MHSLSEGAKLTLASLSHTAKRIINIAFLICLKKLYMPFVKKDVTTVMETEKELKLPLRYKVEGKI